MLPNHQAPRKLQRSLWSMRHTSEKFCSASHTEWKILHCLLPTINQYGQILANLTLVSSAGTLRPDSNARPMRGKPGLQSYSHAFATDLATSLWNSLGNPTKNGYFFHPIKWKQKVFPLSTMNGPTTLFDKRFKHSLQGTEQSSPWWGTFTKSSIVLSADLTRTGSQPAEGGAPVFPGWHS